MSKRVKAGALDESMIIQSFKDDNLIADPASAVRSEPGAPIPSAEPRNDAAEVSASAQSEATVSEDESSTVKVKSRRRRGGYEDTFLKVKEFRARQSVYISQPTHQAILKLVHLLALKGIEISVGGYIDNVMADHFQQHRDDIAEMFQQHSLKDFL